MESRSQALMIREASRQLTTLTRDEKGRALHTMADAVAAVGKELLVANVVSVDAARRSETPKAVIGRPCLDGNQVRGMVDGSRNVAALPDPVGDLARGWRFGNGVGVRQVRVPFGVVGIIYENRPDVTVDAVGLYLESGNVALLYGSSPAIELSRICVEAPHEGLRDTRVSADAVALVERGREVTGEMVTARGLVDVLILRGGAELINTVVEEAKVPVIKTGTGNYYLYMDASADIGRTVVVLLSAKTQRLGVCNAVEALLVRHGIVDAFPPATLNAFCDTGVTVHGTSDVVVFADDVVPAGGDEFDAEYLLLNLVVRIVTDIDEAITHTRHHTTGYSETVIIKSQAAADRFVAEIDVTAALVDASSRFVDGGRFRFGAEVGISIQKLHTRDPMDLAELISTECIVGGDGQMRIWARRVRRFGKVSDHRSRQLSG